jgi:Orsellinic acid/F9775 biosynthesis cluster protein D
MDQFEDIFEYLSEFKVIICKTCRYAVPPTQVNTHLRDQHRMPVNQRSSIVKIVRGIDELAQCPEEVQYSRRARIAVGMLPVYRDGLICTAEEGSDKSSSCGFVSRSRRHMQTHCTQVHGWKNQQKRGRVAGQKTQHPQERMWKTGQAYQRLFVQGN